MQRLTRLRYVDTTGLQFRVIDAKEQVVGRLASQIAKILQGKDKPTYAPYLDVGDICIVKNAEKVNFTGRKWERKLYRWHTGYPGGLRERTAQKVYDRKPEDILYKAVKGMLPKNNLQRPRLRKLRLIIGDKIPNFGNVNMFEWNMPKRNLYGRNKYA